MTVRQAVTLGRWAHRGWWRPLTRYDRALVAECIDTVGMAGLAREQLGELSGGQYRRVVIAQGLAQESDLLLLDEPTAGLDADARRRILEIIDQFGAGGVAVVHATHDAAAARRAGHGLPLEGGRLVAEGDPAALVRASRDA
ncbi:MAG: ATP-binding cassette domain-containing protein [Streptosporangiales bacterium]|nr:ATP-binding cassette domain-containing protein [Streptosporangiales bacterium]